MRVGSDRPTWSRWMDPHSEMIEALQKFLTTKVYFGEGDGVTKERSAKLGDVQVWIQVCTSKFCCAATCLRLHQKLFIRVIYSDAFDERLADKLTCLSEKFIQEKLSQQSREPQRIASGISATEMAQMWNSNFIYTLNNLAKLG